MFGLGVRRIAVAAAVVAAVGLLSGCVGADPKPTPKPTPSATPLFSSDEEALKAAEASYQRYLEVLNGVANEGWVDTTPLEQVETGHALSSDKTAAAENASKGLRSTGAVTFDRLKIQQLDTAEVTAYLCLDVSQTRVLDSQGSDVTSPNRTEVTPIEVTFKASKGNLLLSRSKKWTGTSFC